MRAGVVRNAVLILHGTGGTGAGFLSQAYGGELFGSGQLLDADALLHHPARQHRPRPVEQAERRPAHDVSRATATPTWCGCSTGWSTEGLGLTHLRLVMGTSMGAMHAWMWGYMYPEFADGLVPLASNPVEIAGRNRVWRKLLVDAIVTDPTWKDGDYTEPPRGLASALGFLLMATSVPLQWQKQFPTARRRPTRGSPIRSRRAAQDHRRQRHDLPLPRVARTTIRRRIWSRSRRRCWPSTRPTTS